MATHKPTTMKPEQYRKIRKKLGYSNYAFCRIIGVSLRQAYRYEKGEQKIPECIAKLVLMYNHFGVPVDFIARKAEERAEIVLRFGVPVGFVPSKPEENVT